MAQATGIGDADGSKVEKEFKIMSSLVQRVLWCSAILFLLIALGLAQSGSSQSAAGRLTPIAPTQSGPGVRAETAGGQGEGNSSVQFAAGNPIATATANRAPNPEMLIGPGDLLEVSVFGAPEYIKQVRVSGEGEVTLPLAGAVKVGGMTTAQAETAIAKKLSDGGFFNDPRVSVLEKEFTTQGISVLGEVQKPGIYPLPGSRKLFDALSAAGGTTARAGQVISLTRRDDPQHPQTIQMSYDAKTSDQVNVPIYPGDTVMVSKAGVVYVTGDVKMPGGFVMENSRMTVLQAIAMAQGTTPTARLDSAVVIRKSTQGAGPQEIPIPLKKILSSKAADVNLQAEDIVFVPNSAAKSAGKRTLEAIVQAATGMAIYAR